MDQENKTEKSNSSSSSLFLAEENLCGQTLLSLVGRGHSILADIRILSERIPSAVLAAANLEDESEPQDTPSTGLFGYFGSHQSKPIKKTAENNDDTDDVKKYAPFLFDFSYLHNPEEWEASLSVLPSDAHPDRPTPDSIADLEREFAVNHRAIIEEFYGLFDSIYNYQVELNQFASDLSKGYFIQYTMESMLLDTDGRTLLCEAVWLYGVMLIMMERFLPVSKVCHLILLLSCLLLT